MRKKDLKLSETLSYKPAHLTGKWAGSNSKRKKKTLHIGEIMQKMKDKGLIPSKCMKTDIQ